MDWYQRINSILPTTLFPRTPTIGSKRINVAYSSLSEVLPTSISVIFRGKNCSYVLVISSDTVSCLTSSSTTSGAKTLELKINEMVSSTIFYYESPVISSISVRKWKALGGETMFLRGYNFGTCIPLVDNCSSVTFCILVGWLFVYKSYIL